MDVKGTRTERLGVGSEPAGDEEVWKEVDMLRREKDKMEGQMLSILEERKARKNDKLLASDLHQELVLDVDRSQDLPPTFCELPPPPCRELA